ncbi:MAG: hypothetical protein QME81_18320, partial [bacterium]|nr:hypothetical protein [bacterium]
MMKTFNFSEPFLKAEYIENVDDFLIDGRTIVINADDAEIVIEGKSLKPWNSSIYSSLVIPKACKLICITLDTDFFSFNSHPHANVLMNKWLRFKGTNLWYSEKERISDIGFNLWYAATGTNCGIHDLSAASGRNQTNFGLQIA